MFDKVLNTHLDVWPVAYTHLTNIFTSLTHAHAYMYSYIEHREGRIKKIDLKWIFY